MQRCKAMQAWPQSAVGGNAVQCNTGMHNMIWYIVIQCNARPPTQSSTHCIVKQCNTMASNRDHCIVNGIERPADHGRGGPAAKDCTYFRPGGPGPGRVRPGPSHGHGPKLGPSKEKKGARRKREKKENARAKRAQQKERGKMRENSVQKQYFRGKPQFFSSIICRRNIVSRPKKRIFSFLARKYIKIRIFLQKKQIFVFATNIFF